MTFKYIGFVFIAVCSFFFGNGLAVGEKKRIDRGEGMYRLLSHICREIENFRTPLDLIYSGFTDKTLEEIGLLEKIRKRSLEQALSESGNIFCYGEATYKALLSFAANLGKSDPADQVSRCRYIISLVSEDVKKAWDIYPKNKKMYSSLSLLAGAMIIILLV